MAEPEQCFYCKRTLFPLGERYIVRKAVKPKRTRNRWQKIGYCCVECEAKGANLNRDDF